MSAGSNDTSLCAVVMPTVGVGWHWMPGYTNATSGSCDVVCASNPCYEGSGLLVSTGLSEYPSISVLPWDGLPVRCACICNGTNCSAQKQDRLAAWHSCELRYPTLTPRPVSAPDENASLSAKIAVLRADLGSPVFGDICRSDVHGTKGLTGWLDEFGSSGQRSDRLCRIAWYAPTSSFEALCINIDRS